MIILDLNEDLNTRHIIETRGSFLTYEHQTKENNSTEVLKQEHLDLAINFLIWHNGGKDNMITTEPEEPPSFFKSIIWLPLSLRQVLRFTISSENNMPGFHHADIICYLSPRMRDKLIEIAKLNHKSTDRMWFNLINHDKLLISPLLHVIEEES